MVDQVSTSNPLSKPPVFRNVLVRRVLGGLLFIALIPILVISILNFLRTQNVLQTQVISQLSSLSSSYSQQVEQYSTTRRQALDQINQSAGFDTNILTLYQGKSASSYYLALSSITNYFNQYIQTPTEKIFDQVSIVDSAGLVLVSSNQDLTGKNLTDSFFLRSLYQSNSSAFSYDPGGLFPGQLVLVTTKIYKNPLGAPGLTLIGFSTSSLPLSLLNTSQSFFPSSNGYLLTADNKLVSADPETGLPIVNEIPQDTLDTIKTRLASSGEGQDYQYLGINTMPVYGYYKALRFAKSDLIIEVPREAILGQIRSMVPFTLIVLAALMVVSGVLVYLSSRRMVRPLTELAKNAQTFAAGDWSYRAKINRDDEIGLLAYSFNNMVDQLTGYYRSLEEKVEIRTQQLREVAEVAQTASVGLNQRDIFHKASELISEKLDLPYHAIYSVDPIARTLTLIEQGAKVTGSVPEIDTTLPIDSESMVGWVALNNQHRLTGNLLSEENLTKTEGLIESALSQIAIPITIEDTVIGVLDLQSQRANEYDNESITVYSSLVNQLATGLRNVQVIESAQVGLKESNALYSGSRQITIAQSLDEVDRHLATVFSQTNYVSFFFSVLEDQVHLINITDPKGTRLDQTLKGFNIPLAKGLTRLSSTGMMILDDLKTESDFSNLTVYFDRRGCTSIALLPINISKELGYLLVIGSREPQPITTLQMQPYLSLSQVAGTTIERLSLLSNLNQRVKELSTLTAISQSATNASTLDELFDRLHTELNATYGKEIGFFVGMVNQENNTLDIPYYKEKDPITISSYPLTDDLASSTVKLETPVLHKDASVLGLRTIENGEISLTTKSFLGLPLIFAGKSLGVIALFNSELSSQFSETDISLINTILPQISSSIQSARLLQSQQTAIRAFEQEKFLLNSLLSNIPDEIIFKNTLGDVIRMSDSASRRLSLKEIVDNSGIDVENGENETESDKAVIETNTPVVGIIEEVEKIDGNKGWSLSSKIPLQSEKGEVAALLKISRDVTELVQTQNIAKRRANQLITTSEIAREATTGNLDINETLKRLVDLVKDRFGFYHASIFLLDALGQFAILRESTGEAGAELKAKGHRLAVGSASIIGQTTSKGEPVVVGDVTKELNYYPNPLLPNTKSELGIPLKIGDRIFGALDVQSEEVDAFSPEDINILRILADQLTVTIQNANLYTKTQQTLERHRILQQVTTTAGQNLTLEDAIRNSVQTLQRIFPKEKISLLIPTTANKLKISSYAGYSATDIAKDEKILGEGLLGKIGTEKKPQFSIDVSTDAASGLMFTQSRSFLAVPVVYGERLLGIFDLENDEPGIYDENDQEIILTLASNLASMIANIELVDQIKLQVERQRQLYEISSKIRRSTDVETIMRTSLSEICTALNIRKASIELLQQQEISEEPVSEKGK